MEECIIENIEEIPKEMFSRCTTLKKVQLPNTLKHIGEILISSPLICLAITCISLYADGAVLNSNMCLHSLTFAVITISVATQLGNILLASSGFQP